MSEYTAYQRHAMTVACFRCGAAIGEPCVETMAEVPPDACRVHVVRVIAADATRGPA